MPLKISDINNSETIKFLIENYDRTAKIRMRWNQTYEGSIKKAASLEREEKGYLDIDVFKCAMVREMATIARDNQESAVNRRVKPIRDATFIPGVAHLRKAHSVAEVALGTAQEDPRLTRPDTDLTFDPKMRLIDQKQSKILYKNAPFFGREVYLKERSQILPENRYYFRETESLGYGWRLKECYFGKGGGSKYGRVWRLMKGNKSRTGPQPDPVYYQNSDKPGVSKCFS